MQNPFWVMLPCDPVPWVSRLVSRLTISRNFLGYLAG
jgi:hypothetical protein